MIQIGTFIKVVDNSGAKQAYCIKILKGYKRRYAGIGDLIFVSVKRIRSKRKRFVRAKKGELFKALIIRIKKAYSLPSGDAFIFLENAIILLTKQNKLVGTRIFGVLPKLFYFTKFSKLVSVSSGLIS